MKKKLFSLILSTFTATTLIAAPQAVVFDFGGVLTREPNRAAVVNFIKESFQMSEEEFEKVNQEKRLAINQGSTDEDFWLAYAKTKGIILPSNWSASFKSAIKAAIGVNAQMYLLVDELLEQGMLVALLSNIDERLSKLIRECGFYKPFAPCLLSCEIGVEKPNPKIYKVLLQELNLPAEEVVFIDDLPDNTEAAKKIGLDAILFESEYQLRAELSKRGLLNDN